MRSIFLSLSLQSSFELGLVRFRGVESRFEKVWINLKDRSVSEVRLDRDGKVVQTQHKSFVDLRFG